MCNSLVRKLQF